MYTHKTQNNQSSITSKFSKNKTYKSLPEKDTNNRPEQSAIDKRYKTLTQNLKPFDTNIRVDLIAQLISTFDLWVRGSYVNGFRIAVNQAALALALARAFKLPVKKDKSNASAFSSEVVNLNSEALSEVSIAFIENFVSNRFLLHGGMWQMTVEVLNWRQAGDKRRAVREGGLGWVYLDYVFDKEEDYVENPKVVAEVTLEKGGGEPKLVAEVELKEEEGGEEPKVEAELELKEKDGGEEPKVVMEVIEGGEEPKVVAEVEFKEEEGGEERKVEVEEDGEEHKVVAEVEFKEEEGGEERKVEVEEDGEEHKVEAVFEVKEEENGPEVNTAGSDDFQGQESHDDVMMEAPNVDLTLGLENIEMEVEEQGVEEPKVVAEVEVKVEEGDKESKVVEVGLKEEENGEEPKLEAEFEVEEEDGEEPKVEASDDFRGQESDGDVVVEAPYVVLTLAQEIVETEEVKDGNMMDIEKSKEVKGHWLLDGKNTTGDHFLQPCNMEDDKGMDSDNKERKPEEEKEKEDEDEEEEDDGFNLTPGGHNLEGIETFNRDMVPGRGSASQHQIKNIKWSPNPVVFTNDVMSSFGMMLKS
ncbi:unnamed protein product [Camellia sinensis]